MNELAIAEDVVQTVLSRSAGRRVVGVHLVVGRLSTVMVHALEISLELALEGTRAQGCALVVELVAGGEVLVSSVEVA